jgi:hypothetical protein
MLSGTGIRDAVNGGYLDLNEIGISDALRRRISKWLSEYEDAHFHQYNDEKRNAALDEEGVEIARTIKTELPSAKVAYFSSAYMRALQL